MARKANAIGILTAAAVMTLGATAPAAAAVKLLKPKHFRSMNTGQQELRTPGYLSTVAATPARYYAPLKLRPGSRIQRVVLYYRHTASSSASLSLMRAKFDAGDEALFGTSVSGGNTGGVATTETSSGTPLRIRAGWQYYVEVNSDTNGNFIHGVKVYYQPPR